MIKNIYISLGIILFTIIQVNAQACEEDVPVTNNTVTGNQTIEANNSITARGANMITSTAKVIYRANYEITLGPDFDVNLGANFDAYIGECEGAIYSDTYIANQWGHFNAIPSLNDYNGIEIPSTDLGSGTDVFGAWEITKGSSNITVAILDSGVDLGHEDIDNTRFINGYNFVNDNSNYEDTHGHGTLVTGILGATPNNEEGMAGVDWNCKIMPLKIVPDPSPFNTIIPTNIAKAVTHAKNNGANIISMSFGYAEQLDFELERAFRDAIDANLLLFAATGNDNSSSMDYPARYPSIVGVGALGPCDERKSSTSDQDGGSCDQDNREDLGINNWGSNYGEGLNFLAPGTLLPTTDIIGIKEGYSQNDIYESDDNGDYILDAYGTSMSSPFAAGIASLILSVNPNLKNYQVLHIMEETARNIASNNSIQWDIETGFGALNAKEAVEMARTFVDSQHLLPNLTLEFTNNPDTVTPGNDLIIKFKVKNTGDKIAAPSELKYTFNDNTIVLAVNTLNPQQSSEEYTIAIPYPIENCYGPADFFDEIIFEVDTTNTVTEFNEFNTFKHSYLVTGLPDFIIDSVTLNSLNKSEIKIDVIAKNIGNFSGGLSSIGIPEVFKIYGSINAEYDENMDIDLGIIMNRDLLACPNELTIRNYTKTIATNELQGFNYLFVKVDSANLIEESNEDNNISLPKFINATSILPIYNNTKEKNKINDDSQVIIELIPNPIQDSGIIKYNLEKESTVSISISDLKGFNLNTILADKKLAKGSHEIPIYKSSLNTGIYIIEISVNGEKYFKKMIIK